ncbi:uncharacterized protein BDW43DRAFT_275382 [Aspergillus alliaceus]|uniref:uncharacterized protein n=1 Tax=Petromyces alliaceus TaxID=209559 RepID=UPI0012A4F2AE|nr:uncharacterized protein BDW43DRAFT_275382 [Aspergillus alliaceus]KAB8233876.1 hypothetical protein BDW43DRAFT_275382 [Aspergillus alliaceus]
MPQPFRTHPIIFCARLVNVSGPPYDTLHSHARVHPPLNFTRVLYIPRHDSMTSHLPLYDVAERYQNSIRGSVFGSYLHSVNLSYMEKPRGDNMSARVEYLVDSNKEMEKCSRLQVQRRTLEHGNNIAATA